MARATIAGRTGPVSGCFGLRRIDKIVSHSRREIANRARSGIFVDDSDTSTSVGGETRPKRLHGPEKHTLPFGIY